MPGGDIPMPPTRPWGDLKLVGCSHMLSQWSPCGVAPRYWCRGCGRYYCVAHARVIVEHTNGSVRIHHYTCPTCDPLGPITGEENDH